MNRLTPSRARRKLGACVLAQRAAAAQSRYGPGESRARVGSAEFDARGAPHDLIDVRDRRYDTREVRARPRGRHARAPRYPRCDGGFGASTAPRTGRTRSAAAPRARSRAVPPRRAAPRRAPSHGPYARAFEGGEGVGGRWHAGRCARNRGGNIDIAARRATAARPSPDRPPPRAARPRPPRRTRGARGHRARNEGRRRVARPRRHRRRRGPCGRAPLPPPGSRPPPPRAPDLGRVRLRPRGRRGHLRAQGAGAAIHAAADPGRSGRGGVRAGKLRTRQRHDCHDTRAPGSSGVPAPARTATAPSGRGSDGRRPSRAPKYARLPRRKGRRPSRAPKYARLPRRKDPRPRPPTPQRTAGEPGLLVSEKSRTV